MLNRCCTGFQMLKHICMVQYVCTLLPETVHSAYMFLFELEGFGCWSVKEVVVTSLGSALRCYRVLISRGQRRLAKLLVSRVFSWIWIPTRTELQTFCMYSYSFMIFVSSTGYRLADFQAD
jgi:hypothetical protein